MLILHLTSIYKAKMALSRSFTVPIEGFEDYRYFYTYVNIEERFFHSSSEGAVLEFEWPDSYIERMPSTDFPPPGKCRTGVLYVTPTTGICVAPSIDRLTFTRAAIGYPDKDSAREALISNNKDVYMCPTDLSANDERIIEAFGKDSKLKYLKPSNIQMCRDFFVSKIGKRFSVLPK